MPNALFSELRKVDAATKPEFANSDWKEANLYFNEQSRGITEAINKVLGVGLREGERSLEVNLLRSIVERLAVVYNKAATRWLKRGTDVLGDEDPEQQLANMLFERARLDLSWQKLDRLRTLQRQVVLRIFPSDARRSAVYSPFEPHQVMRWPDPAAGDMMAEDAAFALQLEGDDNEDAPQTWEFWWKDGPAWRMQRVDEAGNPKGFQPFAESDFVSPYDVLPVMQVYDEIALGRTWLAPRSTRIAWAQALNAIINDLWRLVVEQAHSQMAVSTDEPESVPRTTGPGTVWTLPSNATAQVLTNNPKIADASNLFRELQGVWALVEDLPPNTFDKQRQILTGAALRVSEKALNARRDAQVPLAMEDERLAFEAFRAVHNVHAGSWGMDELSEDTDLRVQVGDTHQPVDSAELQNAAFRDIEAGAGSIIDYIQRRDGVPRHVAIKIWERVQADNEKYPSGAKTNLSAPSAPTDQSVDPGEELRARVGTPNGALASVPSVG